MIGEEGDYAQSRKGCQGCNSAEGISSLSGDMKPDDPYDLDRFLSAQERVYERALAELKSGEKRTHWMWFIFPQIEGLGHSPTARRYAIKSIEEARQFLNHSVLGKRLMECTEALVALKGRSVSEVFGYPDDLKFKSSMTLFEKAAGSGSVFSLALDKYCHGERDAATLKLLEKGTFTE